jgi:hypothetical protein
MGVKDLHMNVEAFPSLPANRLAAGEKPFVFRRWLFSFFPDRHEYQLNDWFVCV